MMILEGLREEFKLMDMALGLKNIGTHAVV
jgi:hypothetical protein